MATQETKDGLDYIIQAINNIVEPKVSSLKYDKTYRAKVTSVIDTGVYTVQILGVDYQLNYNGSLEVGDIVKVKAPLNNFSDIYIETLPSTGGSGGTTDYTDLTNKPVLNTNISTSQEVSNSEIIRGTISLHKISKTGDYDDLNNLPSLDFIPTSEKGTASGVATLNTSGTVTTSQLPIASTSSLGAVKVGNNLTILEDGTLNSIGGSGGTVSDTLPIGSVVEWYSDTIPENWLVCDGSAISRTDYADLYAILGTKYGEGDGSTTFNLPNMNSRFAIGQDSTDTDFETIGQTGGEKEHTLTVEEMPSHDHLLNGITTYGDRVAYAAIGGSTGGTGSITGIQDTGGDQPHNNMPPYMVIYYLIKAKQAQATVATVIDDLTSTSATDALSANQGRILNNSITTNSTSITNLQNNISTLETEVDNKIDSTEKGVANGVATLDSNSTLTNSQLPIASTSSLGAIKIGDNLSITSDGTLSATGGGGGGVTVVDNLTSTSTTSALSANQGRILNNSITTMQSELLDKIYPVGSIYISTVNNSPANFLGGTWEDFGYGRTLVGVDDSEENPDLDFASSKLTGGEKEHTLTVDEMPSHSHGVTNFVYNSDQNPFNINPSGTSVLSTATSSVKTDSEGGGQAHNNMPPYITVYMWERTA